MKAINALQAATEQGGFELQNDMTAQDIREYFSPANFVRMFGDASECGGYTLSECCQAVLDHLEEPEPVATIELQEDKGEGTIVIALEDAEWTVAVQLPSGETEDAQLGTFATKEQAFAAIYNAWGVGVNVWHLEWLND